MSYTDFLDAKTHAGADQGFDPIALPSSLFDFQQALVTWALRKGRAAIFADCGLGKTLMELVWADNVARKEGLPVLILTPLAVSSQMVREGEKFGIECRRSQDGRHLISDRIVVTNYERLDAFKPGDFSGVVCDESSILKSFDGAYRGAITEFMRKVRYRLLATATAAPNDYIELGTSSEALGYLGHMDMLGRFFKNDQNNCATRRLYGEAPKWRFKGHAEIPFWRWVTSWARACRKPSDLGFDDGRFILPELIERRHQIDVAPPEGMLLNVPARDLREQRIESKRTLHQRCDLAAALANHQPDRPALAWCHTNAEGDLLEELIPDAVQVSGSDSDDEKEARLLAFARGDERVLITKDKIAGWGMNFQHCNHVIRFPSHSYEGYYQAVRRCWRFGQTRPVTVDLVHSAGESRVMANLARKGEAAGAMFGNLVAEMNRAVAIDRAKAYTDCERMPTWL